MNLNTLFRFIFLPLFAVSTLSACGDLELPTDEEDNTNGSADNTTGDTDSVAVLHVRELSEQEDGANVCVGGYIVGYVPSGSIKKTVFSSDDAVASNIVLADSKAETDYTNCAAVQLEADTDIREELNLQDNPDRLHAFVYVFGTKQKYYSAAGIKSAYDYQLGDEDDDFSGDDAESSDSTAADPAAPTSCPDIQRGASASVFEGA